MAENSNLIIDYIKTKSGIAQINYESLANLPDLSNISSNDIYIAKVCFIDTTVTEVPEGFSVLGQTGGDLALGHYIDGEATYTDIQAAIQAGKAVYLSLFEKMQDDSGSQYIDTGVFAPFYMQDAKDLSSGNFVFQLVIGELSSADSLKTEAAYYIECTPTQVGSIIATISPQFFLINVSEGTTSGTLQLENDGDWSNLGALTSGVSDEVYLISYLWQNSLSRLYYLIQENGTTITYQTLPQYNDNGVLVFYTAVCDTSAKTITIAEKTLSASSGGSITLDSTPTAGSTNGVTSDGVYSAVSAISDRLDKETTPTEGSTNILTSGDIYSVQQNLIEAVNKRSTGRVYADTAAMEADIAVLGDSLKIGDVAYITATGVADYWWNGTTYIEIETKTDLSGYLTKTNAEATYVAKANLPAYYTFVTSTTAPASGTANTIVTFVTEA